MAYAGEHGGHANGNGAEHKGPRRRFLFGRKG
jgi:hypothetical protein